MNILFHVENSQEIGKIMNGYDVADFIIPPEYYIEQDKQEKFEELRKLDKLFENSGIDTYRYYKQKIEWSESQGTDRLYGNVTEGNLPAEAVSLFENSKILQSFEWRQLYLGFADFAYYACLQGDFHLTASRSYADWVHQLNKLFNPGYDGDYTHLLTVVMTQVLSEINGYYIHKDSVDKATKKRKDFIYVFQKQERTRLYFLQQFLEQKRRASINRSFSDKLSREFPASASIWWSHYYNDSANYEGNQQEVNAQYKRDIHAAELDHLVIMDLLFEDLKSTNFATENELYHLLIETMIDETTRKLEERDNLDGFTNTLEDDIKKFHEYLETRRREQGDVEPAVNVQSRVEHNKYATYDLVKRVVMVQLNTFQLESNSKEYSEKFLTVNTLASRIQNWMKNSDSNTDFTEMCTTLLDKNYENSLQFKSWIEQAYPSFDMKYQNVWVSNEKYFFDTMQRHTLSHDDIKNIVYYSISREFRWFLLLQNIFDDSSVHTEDLTLRSRNDNTRFLLKVVEIIVIHYTKSYDENPDIMKEFEYENIDKFQSLYLFELIDNTLSDESESKRLHSGRFAQQCGFLKAYAERYNCLKDNIQEYQDTYTKRVEDEQEKRHRQYHSGYDVNYTHHHDQHPHRPHGMQHQGHGVYNVNYRHDHIQHQHIPHNNTHNNTHNDDDYQRRLQSVEQSDHAALLRQQEDDYQRRLQSVEQSDHAALLRQQEDETNKLRKNNERKKISDNDALEAAKLQKEQEEADALLAEKMQKEDDEEYTKQEEENTKQEEEDAKLADHVRNQHPEDDFDLSDQKSSDVLKKEHEDAEKLRRKQAFDVIAKKREADLYEKQRMFRKHLDDYVYPPYRYIVNTVYNTGKDNWMVNDEKLKFTSMKLSISNAVYIPKSGVTKQEINNNMDNFNKLRKDMYERIIDSKGQKGNIMQDFDDSFAENALPWIRYRLMIELESSVFKSTTGSTHGLESTSFYKLNIGAASALELAIIERYSATPVNLFWNICSIYIGGKETLKNKNEFRNVYLEGLDEYEINIQDAHMLQFDTFFQREDPPNGNGAKSFSEKNDYFVDFI